MAKHLYFLMKHNFVQKFIYNHQQNVVCVPLTKLIYYEINECTVHSRQMIIMINKMCLCISIFRKAAEVLIIFCFCEK